MRRAYVSEVTHFAGICSFSVYYRNCAVQPGLSTFVDKFWVNVVVTLSLNDIITVSICKKTTKY